MGTQFINHVIDDLLKLMHTNKRDFLAGEHTQNAIVERRSKEVNRHLKNILFDTEKSGVRDALSSKEF